MTAIATIAKLSQSERIQSLAVEITDVVYHAAPVIKHDEGDPLVGDAAKIRRLVREVERAYHSVEGRSCPAFSLVKEVDRKFTSVQLLVGATCSRGIDSATKARAIYALILLEKVDPFLRRINYELAIARNKRNSKEVRVLALRNLDAYSVDPLERVVLSFPLRPYSIPKRSAHITKGKEESPHDLFWKISAISLGERHPIGVRNLVSIAKREGFKVDSAFEKERILWLRDHVLFKKDGGMLLPARLYHKDAFRNKTIRVLIDDTFQDLMGGVAEWSTFEKFSGRYHALVTEAPFYFEGGNLLEAMNGKDQICYLSGAHNLLFSLVNATFTFAGQEEALLKCLSGFQGSDLFADVRVTPLRKRLIEAQLMPKVDEETEIWITELALAAIEFIKNQMEEVLDHPVVHVGDPFEAQPDFHIDMFLAPAPDGRVFLLSHELCIKLLRELLKNDKLSLKDRKRLIQYLGAAHLKNRLVGNMLKDIGKQLETAGFKVIPTPGVFFANKKLAVNFINGLFGRSKNGDYFITNGSSHPVDELLRKAFASFLRAHKIGSVYFTGREREVVAGSALDYTEAQHGLNLGGGIHCKTLHTNVLFQKAEKADGRGLFLREAKTPLESIIQSLPAFFEQMVKRREKFNADHSSDRKSPTFKEMSLI